MNQTRASWYVRWQYGARALRSTPRRSAITTGLTVIFIGVALWIVLSGAGNWLIWVVSAAMAVTWLALGRWWLHRDLADAVLDDEIRTLLEGR